MAQQSYPPSGYPPPYYFANGNGSGANLARSYVPTVMVVSLLIATGLGVYTATNWLRDKSDTERSLGQRIDGVQVRLDEQGRRLESIDGTLKRLVTGTWAPQVQPSR
jgi:hypothetical protein